MKEVLDYLKATGTFYLATNEEDQPRVRPFGAVCEFEGKLYIATNNKKPVFEQMIKNPKVEISCMSKGTWLRLEAEAIQDDRTEARAAMIEDNKASLSKMYSADDGIFEVLYLKNATASIFSFTGDPKVIKF
ncbi:pyridoxamine 5'-phosphate oxidase family protein [Lacrimispora aerotolerans]|uniref:pyridoxamine 5'-phosphate oxidase family protein n=1 Tax=Lacrimispora aerotolerans TaxID=36832 RepID=UPI00047E0509|nr:pyridoxamine 5'-phosphate oxidase family protein [Lacrimispora aerotolerans]